MPGPEDQALNNRIVRTTSIHIRRGAVLHDGNYNSFIFGILIELESGTRIDEDVYIRKSQSSSNLYTP
jgi:hypothetical protein